ncbi:MAG TPA: SMP-30/gluconolactonase/LRE family protein [Methylophilaceae bacterium]|nr:SMP-30/gluconolactonase/LRE family protein [Methylophilaceae bacterium]
MQTRIKLMLSTTALSLLVLGTQGCADTGKKSSAFKMPESVAVAKDGKVYVSEIGEFGKDGDGQISVLSSDGTPGVFAKGMDDPKGIYFHGDTLFVADNKRVLKVGPDGKSEVFAAAEAFPATPQFLNDVVVDDAGNVYVSDSGDLKGKGGAIYRISPDGKVSTVVDSKNALVLGPNGLLMGQQGELLEVDFVSGILYSINLNSGKLTKLAEGLGAADGLARGQDGTFYVSDWEGGKVFRVSQDGQVKLLKDGYAAAADITLSADGKEILVPDMKAGQLVKLPLQ